jgi:hypothetical protein
MNTFALGLHSCRRRTTRKLYPQSISVELDYCSASLERGNPDDVVSGWTNRNSGLDKDLDLLVLRQQIRILERQLSNLCARRKRNSLPGSQVH